MRPSGSLRFKLALSHLTVLLLAVVTTVTANYFLFRKGFDQRMLAETQARAQEAANSLESASAQSEACRLGLLTSHAASTPVKFSLVSLSAPPRESPGFFEFPLTLEQKRLLTTGKSLSGPITPANTGVGAGHFCAVPVGPDFTRAVVAYAVRMKVPLGKPFASWILQSLILALLPAALVAALLARHLVQPLRTLREATARLACGDYSVRTPHSGRRDELGAVSRDFDRMAQKLEADFQIRTRLLGDISHELGTPVTTLRATAEALIDGLVERPEDLLICHQSILRQVEHLSFLVSDVTELARYETGEVSISQRPFSALDPLQQAADSARLTAYQRGSQLEVSGNSGEAMGDPRRLLQVLKNLIHNAIDHNPPGTSVWATCQVATDSVVYSVEDNGPPIPAVHRQAIFDRFTKLDPSRPRASGGGLGLAIVTEILRAHGTHVTVEDTPRGKAFCFSLRAL